MAQAKWTKAQRMLSILNRLTSGEKVAKINLANDFEVDERTIQRDISDLNAHLSESRYILHREIIYNTKAKVYELNERAENPLTGGEIFAIVKILLESRALVKEEMDSIIDKLIDYSEKQNQKEVKAFILNERYHYKPLQHQKPMIDRLLHMMECIKMQHKLKIRYIRQDKKIVERTIMPMSIMFSEYYFYIATYSKAEDTMPIMYRLDRILDYEILEEKYRMKHETRFEEGEFRKRIQFMYPGELMRITLKFWGASLEALLDRLPTAEVIKVEEDVATVTLEVYGTGIKMWLLSQGDKIEVVEPLSLREEMKKIIPVKKKVE